MSIPRSRGRDLQDTLERGGWGKLTYVDGAGSHISVRGTGTLDEEVPVVNTGYGFNLPENSNTEVVMLSPSSDVNAKMAIPTIPRDKQHQWAEGTGGVQNPTNPDQRIEFNGDDIHLLSGSFKLGSSGEFTLSIADGKISITGGDFVFDGDVRITGDVKIEGDLDIDGEVKNQGTNIGHDHRHDGVERGDSKTDGPE